MYSINELVKTGKRLFHTADLALIWGINKRPTLHMRISRYLSSGVLFPIQRGLYSLVPVEKLSPIEVGAMIYHGFSYLTAESVLETHGVINGRSPYFTFVGEKTKRFEWNQNSYLFRQLKKDFLYRNIGIEEKEGFFVATLVRAVADILYINPKFNFDSNNFIDWESVKKIQKEVGYK